MQSKKSDALTKDSKREDENQKLWKPREDNISGRMMNCEMLLMSKRTENWSLVTFMKAVLE